MSLLRPDEQVFIAMLDGWRAQQLARNLAFDTIDKRLGVRPVRGCDPVSVAVADDR